MNDHRTDASGTPGVRARDPASGGAHAPRRLSSDPGSGGPAARSGRLCQSSQPVSDGCPRVPIWRISRPSSVWMSATQSAWSVV